MKINYRDILKTKPKAFETRVKVHSLYERVSSSKPRDKDEVLALACLNVRRVQDAIKNGRWIIDKNKRRILYRE